jgi:hypothetical protein
MTTRKLVGNTAGSAALVVSLVALVAGLTGVSIALPGKGQVDRNDLGKKVVKTKNIKPGAVNTSRLGNGAVTSPKLGKLTVRTSEQVTLPADAAPGNGLWQARNADARCQPGEVAIGGGVREMEPEADGAQPGLTVYNRYLTSNGTPVGIRGRAGNDFGNTVTFRVEVLCLHG